MASSIFLTASIGVVGLISSSITSHSTSRERTRGEEIAQIQIEKIRTMAYANVGVTNGNPPGTLSASGFSGTVPTGYSVSTDVDYVADPSASSYTLSANYKKVTVTVKRTRDNRQLAKLTTNIAPTTRSSLGGIAGVSLTVKVKDWALPVGSSASNVDTASVTLSNGPDPSRTDVTNGLGELAFLAVTPTNSSAPGNYYDLAVTKTGYVTYPSDISPASAAHMQLAPSQIASTTIRLFKPATLTVALKNGSNPYTGAATVKVYSAKSTAWTTYSVNNSTGTLTLTSISGDYVYPNVLYSVYAYTSSGLCSSEVEQNVPDDYPNVLDSTINLPLGACPSGGLNVNVKQLGVNVSGATLTVTGGPNSVSLPPPTMTTDSSGNVAVTGLPSGTSAYTVAASKTIQGVTYTATGTATVTTNGTTAVDLTLNSPSTATVNATVTAGGSAVSGATVSLSGSPFGVTFVDQTTNVSGVAIFTSVPIGTGYTVSATKSGVSQSNPSLTVTSPTTNTSLALPTGSLTVTAMQYSTGAAGASITVTGGPFSTSQTATANSSGVYTFSNLVTGSGYSVSASSAGMTGTASGITIVTSPTATQTVTIPNPPNGDLTANVKWITLNQTGASVRLYNTTLGYDTTQTTNSSGNTTFLSVPSGSGYTITATRLGGSVTTTSVTVSASPTVNSASLVLPTGTQPVTVTLGGTNLTGASVTLSQSSVPYSVTQTTTSTGTSFTSVPAATGLTASTTTYGQTVSNTSVNVAASPATNSTVTLVIPAGTVTTNVKWAGTNQSGVTVVVANASIGFSKSGTTDASGNVSLTGIPVSSGYTVTATHSSGQSASQSSVAVTNGATTSVNLALPTQSLTVTVTRNGSAMTDGTVSISGGPAGISTILNTTNTGGSYSFINLPVGSSYTVKAWRTSCSGTNRSVTLTNQTVNSTATTISTATNSTTCPP